MDQLSEPDVRFETADFQLFSRHANSIPFNNVPERDKIHFKELREKLKTLATRAAERCSSSVPMRGFTSLYSPNGRSVLALWCCIHPASVPNKSYGLQVALILNEQGAEFCCCLGAGTDQSANPGKKLKFSEALRQAKDNLRNLDYDVVSALSTELADRWDFRKQWRLPPGTKDFRTLKEWLAYAASPESRGASISVNLDASTATHPAERITDMFYTTTETFKPLIEAIYGQIGTSTRSPLTAAPREGVLLTEFRDDAPVFTPSEEALPYTLDNIVDDGCFLDRKEIEEILSRLVAKKNIILQGPPGTGKTWLGRRLAFALMGSKDESHIRAVQFHPNMSYEDFVRGWRPTADGKLTLVEGIFMEVIANAIQHGSAKFVVLIEEINRGSPAQIFGELLTLLDSAKRLPEEALELSYPAADGKHRPVYIPDNVYVIGTMNIADRSLAMVDLALRRRFAFVDLEPKLGETWRSWVISKCNLAANLVPEIEKRIAILNEQIASDPRLGRQFRIGHSYVTPSYRLSDGETNVWFSQVVRTELRPLLEEYWFDAPDEARKACDRLMQNW